MTDNGLFYSGGTGGTGLSLTSGGSERLEISTSGIIKFNQSYNFPTSDGSANTVLLTNGSGSLSFGTVPNAGLTNSSVTVTAGNGLANGGSVSLGGSVTLNVGAGTGIQVNANDVALDYAGTNNFIDSATNLEGTAIAAGDTIVYHDATDNNVKKGLVSDLPFTNNVGTVTSVGIDAGALIDVSNTPITTSGNITVSVDLSELTTSTNDGDGDFFAVVDASNVQRKLTKGNINISGFNNDAGYITSAGNTNIYNLNGTLLGNRLLQQDGNTLNFSSSGDEMFQVYKSTNTAIRTPRVRFEADDAYTTVLELHSSRFSTSIVEGYDTTQSPVFTVDGSGNLFATSKSFLIEHPSKDGFNLRHGSLEGPEHGVYVRGKLDGNNTIELPDYWNELIDKDSITVQLTPIGSHQNLYVKDIVDNKVIVANSALLSSKIKCFYFIQAERKDIDKMVVEYPRETPTL